MELFSSVLIIIPLFFFFLLLIQLPKTLINGTSNRKKLPPGPWKLPLVGNLLQLAFAGSLPHHALKTLAKKHGPIFHLQLGEISTVVISSPRIAKEVLKTHDLAVANRPKFVSTDTIFYGMTDVIFSPYGNYWRQMHKICVLELLSAKKVRSFGYIREEEGSRVIESIRSSCGAAPINLGKMIFSLQNAIAFRATFGTKCKDQDTLIDIITDLVAYTGGFDVCNLFPSLKFLYILSGLRSKVNKTHQKLDKILHDIVDEHREKLGARRDDEDLVDVLLRLKETGNFEFPITTNSIKAITLDMFAAGTETSATTIEWAMSELIRNPRVMEKVQAELRQILKGKKVIEEKDFPGFNYLKLVIKETLRLRNPLALLFPRQTREEFVIDGYTIPVGTNIIVNFSAIAKDPEYWHDATSFVPERFENSSIDFKGSDFEFIPFGAGRRMCPGMTFGLASVEHSLAHLLYHFDWKLPNGMRHEELDMSEEFGGSIRRKNSLYVVATPYSQL